MNLFNDHWEVWSCGGGRQSNAIAVLIITGRLPKPDFAMMVDTNRERSSTWRYVNEYTIPGLARVGVELKIIDRSQYVTVDLWSGENGTIPVLPAYTNKSGKTSKLSEYCSGEWKRDVVMRWCKANGITKMRNWLGISTNEMKRRRAPRRQWAQLRYPLLDEIPMTATQCEELVVSHGWPIPPHSSCWMCPNHSDAEWVDIRDNDPDDWKKACELDEEIRKIDPHAWLHKGCIPLAMVDLKPKTNIDKGGCSSGMCF